MATKKEHPADIYIRKMIEQAEYFTIHFRKGPFESYTETAETIEAARVIEARMNSDYGQFGRRASISAIVAGANYPVGEPYRRPDRPMAQPAP